MSNVIKFSITGDTNAEQVTNRAKAAVSGFDKQIEGIGKKFGSAFKDIFLGFAAPMVLLNQAISMISANIEKAKKDAQDGLDLIAKGETQFASSEEAKAAAFFKRKKAMDEEKTMVEAGRAKLTEEVLTTKAFGDFVPSAQIQARIRGGESISSIAKDKGLQKDVFEFFKTTTKGKEILDAINPELKKTDFKPEGLSSNVVGVGQSPGMAVINAQLAVQQEIAEMMRRIAEKYDRPVNDTNFTYKPKPEYSVPAYPQFK